MMIKKNFKMVLDFEKPIHELEKKIAEMEDYAKDTGLDLSEDIKRLSRKAQSLQKEIYSKLTPWQRVQLARHPDRPYTLDYIKYMVTDFLELHGDRYFADDPAIVAGLGMIDEERVAIVGHQKGRDVKENLFRNFGMAHPEGYRKALRIMKLAEKFGFPVVTLIDTPGAYPGIGAEERGQAEAIAQNLQDMFLLKTPVISVVIGEGGSGGALALAVGDRVLMLEHSVYSVISPEGCAAILWNKKSNSVGPKEYENASDALKMTAQDLFGFGVIDEIIPEPLGGAHRNQEETAGSVARSLQRHLEALTHMSAGELLEDRYRKFRIIGEVRERV